MLLDYDASSNLPRTYRLQGGPEDGLRADEALVATALA
jgi:hypothetical protein